MTFVVFYILLIDSRKEKLLFSCLIIKKNGHSYVAGGLLRDGDLPINIPEGYTTKFEYILSICYELLTFIFY